MKVCWECGYYCDDHIEEEECLMCGEDLAHSTLAEGELMAELEGVGCKENNEYTDQEDW